MAKLVVALVLALAAIAHARPGGGQSYSGGRSSSSSSSSGSWSSSSSSDTSFSYGLRIWATGKDFVVDDHDRVITGSKTHERAYSEYWTLVRSAGKQVKPQASAICNNCGAPLQIDEGGACGHCGAHVTSGEFDWVLSKIEQDDSYGVD